MSKLTTSYAGSTDIHETLMKHEENCKCCTDGPEVFWADLEQRIKTYGVAILGTATETPHGELSLSYTIGLSDLGLPEILVFGLPMQAAHVILNAAVSRLKEGNLPLDVPVTELANLPTCFRAVAPTAAAPYIIQANNRAGRELPALQLVWPDTRGRFPWEPEAEARFKCVQPELYSKLN